jgi:hypothetical protein
MVLKPRESPSARPSPWRIALWRIVPIALLVAAGCSFFALRDFEQRFSHRLHIEQEISCSSCHAASAETGTTSMPSVGTCLACHGTSEHREAYPYELEIQSRPRDDVFETPPRFEDLRFSHAAHAAKGVACEACHSDLDALPGSTSRTGTDVAGCEKCHRDERVASNCEVCHVRMREDVRPPSHESAHWGRDHGRALAYGAELAHEESCSLCHSENDCDSCHRVEKPRDHTEHFRMKGHGIAVGIERERCTTCHVENFCVRCHEDTAPRDHFTASWGGTRSNHCVRCHEPLGESRCAVCHDSTLGHETATAIPPFPHPGTESDCYQCHLRPPHADNGMPCITCHR